jgi:hypothetical protein
MSQVRHPSLLAWLVIAALAIGGIAVGGAQRLTTMELQASIEVARQQRADVARLEQENARLRAKQMPAAELEALRADHAAVTRLRRELDALRQK